MSNDQKSTSIDGWLRVIGMGMAAFVLYRGYLEATARWTALWRTHFVLCWSAVFLVAACLATMIAIPIRNRIIDAENKANDQECKDALVIGKAEDGEEIKLTQRMRTTHGLATGTTSTGKTESVILPAAIHDIETGAGLLIVDGKSEQSFLDKLYAYAVKNGRKSHFRLFSLALPDQSATFNPLAGGTPQEIAERVFSSFEFENEHYRNVQYQLFYAVLRLIAACGEKPTFFLVRQLLQDKDLLQSWITRCDQEDVAVDLVRFLQASESDRAKDTSGLQAHLSRFTSGPLAPLFNAEDSMIQMDEVLREHQVVYFQLPSMHSPQLAQAMGRMVLQAFQSAVSRRHLGLSEKTGFFGCYLDDFQDYIYEGFGALLNKSRSANVGVLFSHQSLGDLEKVSPAFKDVVLSNTNIKYVMRCNDPDTRDYFAKSFGTETTEKVTERRKAHVLGDSKTGEGSVREAEAFRFHPNEILGLGVGQGIVSMPLPDGVRTVKVRFQRRKDIEPVPLPKIPKATLQSITKKVTSGQAQSGQPEQTQSAGQPESQKAQVVSKETNRIGSEEAQNGETPKKEDTQNGKA